MSQFSKSQNQAVIPHIELSTTAGGVDLLKVRVGDTYLVVVPYTSGVGVNLAKPDGTTIRQLAYFKKEEGRWYDTPEGSDTAGRLMPPASQQDPRNLRVNTGSLSMHPHAGVRRALAIATKAHRGQTRWNGADYITHPIRVAEAVEDETLKMVALLHDVVEDTPVTLEDLAKEFTPNIVAAVDALTKRPDEEYFDAILRARENELAREVKLADLADNLRDLKSHGRRIKYQKAVQLLESAREAAATGGLAAVAAAPQPDPLSEDPAAILTLRLVVGGANAGGEPDLYFCRVRCRREQYDNADHYAAAIAEANANGFESYMAFDQYDPPRPLFDLFVWETATTVDISADPLSGETGD